MFVDTVKPDPPSSFAIWITGLPASGKSHLSAALVRRLRERSLNPAVLESDVLRSSFSDRPSYDERERDYFYGAIAFIGRVLTSRDIPVIFDATANRRSYRDEARRCIPRFLEVYVECPLEVCIRRDPKGIYRMAREGQAGNVPGIGAVYEPPQSPDFVFHSDLEDADEAAGRMVALLESRGYLPPQS